MSAVLVRCSPTAPWWCRVECRPERGGCGEVVVVNGHHASTNHRGAALIAAAHADCSEG